MLKLHESAFADLLALGWRKEEAYIVCYLTLNGKMSASEAAAKGKAIMQQPEIKERIGRTTNFIYDKYEKILGVSGVGDEAARIAGKVASDNSKFSKDSILTKLYEEAENAEDPKVRIQAYAQVAMINGLKRQESLSKEEATRIYMPAMCSGCSLFEEAVRVGVIHRVDADRAPFKKIESGIKKGSKPKEGEPEFESIDVIKAAKEAVDMVDKIMEEEDERAIELREMGE